MNLVFSIIGSLLMAAVVTSAPEEANYFNSMPVCGSFYDLSKTFANVLEFSEEFINSGKAWKFIKLGACPPTSECKLYNPVCGVNPTNKYQTFLNECLLEADRKMTGTGWQKFSSGICSAHPMDSQQSSSSGNGPSDLSRVNQLNTLSLASAKAVLKYISALSKTVKEAEAQSEAEIGPADNFSMADEVTESATISSSIVSNPADSPASTEVFTPTPVPELTTITTSFNTPNSSLRKHPQHSWPSFIMPINTKRPSVEANSETSEDSSPTMAMNQTSLFHERTQRHSVGPANIYDKISKLYFGASPLFRSSAVVKRQAPSQTYPKPVKRHALPAVPVSFDISLTYPTSSVAIPVSYPAYQPFIGYPQPFYNRYPVNYLPCPAQQSLYRAPAVQQSSY